MKKFLLSLASVLCVFGYVNAATYTITAADLFPDAADNVKFTDCSDNTVSAQGFSFTALKNSGGTEPLFFNSTSEVRIYAKGTLEIKAPAGINITGLSFKLSAQGLKRQSELTPSTGSVNQALNQEDLIWTGSSADITFTVGDKAVYGTEGESKAGQFDFSSVTIYTDGDAPEVPDTPDVPDTPAAEGYAIYAPVTTAAAGDYVLVFNKTLVAIPFASDKPYGYMSVTECVENEDKYTTEKANQFTFIAVEGGYNIKESDGRYLYMTGTYNSFNLAAECPEEGAVWTVTFEDGLAVIKNVAMDKTLQYDSSYGSIGVYSDVRGTYPTLCKYVEDTEVAPVVPEGNEIKAAADVYNLANNDKFVMGIDLTVIFDNGSYTYATDGKRCVLIYKSGLNLGVGSIITKGWEGKVSIYNNLVELVPTADALAATPGTAVPDPVLIEASDLAFDNINYTQNEYVLLKNVTFAAATPAADAYKDDAGNDLRQFTGTFQDSDVTFYHRFDVPSVPAGTYDVVGFVSVYKEAVQVYPTEIGNEKASGISNVAIDANAPAAYYTLQGVKVNTPREGQLYIRVQGGKATKVIK